MPLRCLPVGHKVGICVKVAVFTLIFGSSVSFIRLFEPVTNQLHDDVNATTPTRTIARNVNNPCYPKPNDQSRETIKESEKIIYKSPGIQLYLSVAYLDDRNNETYLRVFGLQRKDTVQIEFSCKWDQMQSGMKITNEVHAKRILIDSSWPTWTPHYAVNFDCKLPRTSSPDLVRLISSGDKHSYTLPVNRIVPKDNRKTLAVCIKPITGHFDVPRLVEWFELIRLSGVDKIILYNSDIIGTGRYVLDYYEKVGVATIVIWPFLLAVLQEADNPPVSPQERYGIYQQTYLLAMHDCLYRFRESYQHLLFIDLDEVLLPTKHRSLVEMTKEIRSTFKNGAGFLFNTAWHFEEFGQLTNDSIPEHLYMQRYARATEPSEVQPKSIIVTDRAISLNFHSILDVPRHDYSNEVLSSEQFAYVHHYRGRCDQKFEPWRCKKFLAKSRVDPVIVRYRNDIKTNVQTVLNYLQMK